MCLWQPPATVPRVQQGAGQSCPGGGAAAHALGLVEGERRPGRGRPGRRRRRRGGGWQGGQGGQDWPQGGLFSSDSLLLRVLPPPPRPGPGRPHQAPLLQQLRLCSVQGAAPLPAWLGPGGAPPLQARLLCIPSPCPGATPLYLLSISSPYPLQAPPRPPRSAGRCRLWRCRRCRCWRGASPLTLQEGCRQPPTAAASLCPARPADTRSFTPRSSPSSHDAWRRCCPWPRPTRRTTSTTECSIKYS